MYSFGQEIQRMLLKSTFLNNRPLFGVCVCGGGGSDQRLNMKEGQDEDMDNTEP